MEGGENPHDNLAKVNFLAIESLENSLTDCSTVQLFCEAILANESRIQGKDVLHITTGCNILYSLIAHKAGANKVYCVVNGHSEVEEKNVYMMKQIVKENECEDKVSVGFWRDFGEEIDVIIGEPMGYNLIYDGMLDRMLEAKDLHMRDKNKGLILPEKVTFKCALIQENRFIDKKVHFWDHVYGVEMQTMKKWIEHEPIVRRVDPSCIVSEVKKFLEFQIIETEYNEIDNICKSFSLTPLYKTEANALCIWFEVLFSTPDGDKIEIKGSPWAEKTKWMQMSLYTNGSIEIKPEIPIDVTFQGKKNHREGSGRLLVGIQGEKIVYNFW